MKTQITFWGIRGSVPAPSPETVKYGGNTACVEIWAGADHIICDAGTGIRPLGEVLETRKKAVKAAILLSHFHWDHIAGFPFFTPFYNRNNVFSIIGPMIEKTSVKESLRAAISPPYFPVSLKDLSASFRFKNAGDKPILFGKVKIYPFELKHPGGALGWRFEFTNKKSLVYISDNEPGDNFDDIVFMSQNADLLIHDSQYTPGEYIRKRGWGHSPYTYAIEIGLKANVKRLVLNHFDPKYGDKKLEEILAKAKELIKKNGSKMKCELATEGKMIQI